MALKQYSDADKMSVEKRDFGLNAVAFHHIQKAKQAGDRLRINISAQNVYAVISEATTLLDHLNTVYTLLADDNNLLTEAKPSKSKK